MFRPVPMYGPDLEILIQVWLLGRGFVHVASLASKIVTLRKLSQSILPCSASEGKEDLGSFLLGSTGWGLQCIQRMITVAGFHLAKCEREYILQREREQEAKLQSELEAANRPVSVFEAVAAANAPESDSQGRYDVNDLISVTHFNVIID
mgnify:CR=1 FL=1